MATQLHSWGTARCRSLCPGNQHIQHSAQSVLLRPAGQNHSVLNHPLAPFTANTFTALGERGRRTSEATSAALFRVHQSHSHRANPYLLGPVKQLTPPQFVLKAEGEQLETSEAPLVKHFLVIPSMGEHGKSVLPRKNLS